MKANANNLEPGVINKPQKAYIGADEVRNLLDVGRATAYRLIANSRKELIEAGKLPDDYPQGKVPRTYFFKRYMIN